MDRDTKEEARDRATRGVYLEVERSLPPLKTSEDCIVPHKVLVRLLASAPYGPRWVGRGQAGVHVCSQEKAGSTRRQWTVIPSGPGPETREDGGLIPVKRLYGRYNGPAGPKQRTTSSGLDQHRKCSGTGPQAIAGVHSPWGACVSRFTAPPKSCRTQQPARGGWAGRLCAGWARLNHPVAETRDGLRSAQVPRCFIRLGQDLDAVVYIELASVYRFLRLFPQPLVPFPADST